MTMLIVKFHAGLGNQMFQFAFYKYLKSEYPQLEIKADLTRYRYDKYLEHNGFELEKIFENMDLDIADEREILKAGGFWERKQDGLADILMKRITLFRSNLYRKGAVYDRRVLDDCSWKVLRNRYPERVADKSRILHGYWADVRVPGDGIFRFRRELYAKDSEMLSRIMSCNAISVHVRRGNYVTTGVKVLGEDYYLRAKKWMDEHVREPVYFLFSDEPEYLEENFKVFKNAFIVKENQGGDSFMDMLFMSCCKHNIICNSTFSFGGGVLNNCPDKNVILPKGYLTNYTQGLLGTWIEEEG